MTLSFKQPFLHISCVLDFQQKDFKQIAKFLSSPILKGAIYSLSGNNQVSSINLLQEISLHSLENSSLLYWEFLNLCKKSFKKSSIAILISFSTQENRCKI